jgi:hypothetical protein
MNYGSQTETDGSTITRGNIVINVTATDTNLKNLSIFLYNSTYHLRNVTSSATSPLWRNYSSLTNGTYYFNATAQDTYGNNAVLAARTVTIQTGVAIINVVSSYPVNGFNSTSSTLNFGCNLTTSMTNITSVTLNVSGTNSWTQTETLGAGVTNYNATFTNTTIADGNYNWNCYAIGNKGNGTSIVRSFKVDTTPPVVNMVYPSNNVNYSSSTWLGQLNYTASDTNLASCWYSIDGGTTNTTVSCGTNLTGLISGFVYYTRVANST